MQPGFSSKELMKVHPTLQQFGVKLDIRRVLLLLRNDSCVPKAELFLVKWTATGVRPPLGRFRPVGSKRGQSKGCSQQNS